MGVQDPSGTMVNHEQFELVIRALIRREHWFGDVMQVWLDPGIGSVLKYAEVIVGGDDFGDESPKDEIQLFLKHSKMGALSSGGLQVNLELQGLVIEALIRRDPWIRRIL